MLCIETLENTNIWTKGFIARLTVSATASMMRLISLYFFTFFSFFFLFSDVLLFFGVGKLQEQRTDMKRWGNEWDGMHDVKDTKYKFKKLIETIRRK